MVWAAKGTDLVEDLAAQQLEKLLFDTALVQALLIHITYITRTITTTMLDANSPHTDAEFPGAVNLNTASCIACS